jgi:cation diffusion facilitator CzcD-associated flavoprotein CzcO
VQKWKTSIKMTGSKDAQIEGFYSLTSDFLLSAVGQLNVPRYPNIARLDDFKGTTTQSARWGPILQIE